jgi:hypothetical protein
VRRTESLITCAPGSRRRCGRAHDRPVGWRGWRSR